MANVSTTNEIGLTQITPIFIAVMKNLIVTVTTLNIQILAKILKAKDGMSND